MDAYQLAYQFVIFIKYDINSWKYTEFSKVREYFCLMRQKKNSDMSLFFFKKYIKTHNGIQMNADMKAATNISCKITVLLYPVSSIKQTDWLNNESISKLQRVGSLRQGKIICAMFLSSHQWMEQYFGFCLYYSMEANFFRTSVDAPAVVQAHLSPSV